MAWRYVEPVTGLDWLLIVALAALLMAPAVRWATRVLRAVPQGKRWAVVRASGRALTQAPTPNRVPRAAPEAVAALYGPAPARRALSFDDWHDVETLVADIAAVTHARDGSYGASLDVDGSALVVTAEGAGYRLHIQRRDGSSVVVARSATGAVLDASIDHGACTWWHSEPHARDAEIRVWNVDDGVVTLGSVAFELDSLVDAPSGWIVMAAGTVVGTLLGGLMGDVYAARPGHPIAHLGRTRFVTVARDVASESAGQARVSITVHGPGTDTSDELTSLRLESFPPVGRPLRRGAFPGATTARDEAVAQWQRPGVLELPGGLWVTPGRRSVVAVDPVSDGEFAAMALYDAHRPGGAGTSPVLLHLPSGARMWLGADSFGRVQLRGEYVMWSEPVTAGASSAVTRVARLRRPAVTDGA